MKELSFEMDEGVFHRVMQKKMKAALVSLPYLPASGEIATVEVKRGKRTVEKIECTIISAEHAGLQAYLYMIEIVRGTHIVKKDGVEVSMPEPGKLSVRGKFMLLLDEERRKHTDQIREQKKAAINRKIELLTRKGRSDGK